MMGDYPMKSTFKKLFAVITVFALVFGAVSASANAYENPFDPEAYASIVTASDVQGTGTEAYDYMNDVLTVIKADGLKTPDALLIGGDFTKLLFDNAVPGISRIRHNYLALYPEADPCSVACVQGNHDNPKDEFAETGFYDMGSFCLYAINENDFPWQQSIKGSKTVEKTAADMEKALDKMISSGDRRPVIVMTHVPLHHTNRGSYGDNMYASYIFNVLNEKANTLDIIFIFGHNHSGSYDDYIGGSVNFLAPGETILVPRADKKGEDCFTEEALNFTYTNCGYVGYSGNTQSDTSTNALTVGVIQLTSDRIRFVKYDKNGPLFSWDVARINSDTSVKAAAYPELDDKCPCHSENPVVKIFWNIWIFFCKTFGIESFCTCGVSHY